MEEQNEFGYYSEDGHDLLHAQFPVHRASRDGDLEALSILMSSGNCDFYEEDHVNGWTPVHWAAFSGKLECIRKLSFLTNDCLDKASSRSGQTPTHLCAYSDHPHCIQWLLQSGACVDCQDFLGETPIHKSARTGSMECVSLLVSQGAKLSLRNHNGRTPSQVAMESGHHECANYLERAMQIQQQATGVYDEMRTPVTQPSSNIQSLNDIKTPPPQEMNGSSVPENDNGDMNNCDMEMDDPSTYKIVNGLIDTGCYGHKINGLNILPNGHSNGLSHLYTNGHMNGDRYCMSGGRRKRGCDDMEEESIKRCRVGDDLTEENNNSNTLVSGVPGQNNTQRISTDCIQQRLAFFNAQLTYQTKMDSVQQNRHNHLPVKAEPTNRDMYTHLPSEINKHAQSSNHMSTSAIEHVNTVSVQEGYDSLIAFSQGYDGPMASPATMYDDMIAQHHGS